MSIGGVAVRLGISGVLAFASLRLFALINRLPYSQTRDTLTDTLTLLGGLVGWVLYPDGVHGPNASGWAWACVVGNLAFYTLLWMLVLSLIARRRLAASGEAKA